MYTCEWAGRLIKPYPDPGFYTGPGFYLLLVCSDPRALNEAGFYSREGSIRGYTVCTKTAYIRERERERGREGERERGREGGRGGGEERGGGGREMVHTFRYTYSGYIICKTIMCVYIYHTSVHSVECTGIILPSRLQEELQVKQAFWSVQWHRFSIYIYIFQAVRTSCRKCSKCFYVYLNIRPMRYSAMQI